MPRAADLDAFLACYADDVIVTDGRGATLMSGRQLFPESYRAMFAVSPDLHAEIVDRQSVGVWTVDRERVSRAGDVLEVLVVYLVERGLIQRAIMLR